MDSEKIEEKQLLCDLYAELKESNSMNQKTSNYQALKSRSREVLA